MKFNAGFLTAEVANVVGKPFVAREGSECGGLPDALRSFKQ